MRRFGAAAILAALCSALCLYGSGDSGGNFQYAARSNQEEVTRPSGSRVHLLNAGLRCGKASVSNGAAQVRSTVQRVISKEEWAHFRFLSPSQTRQYGSDRSQLAASRRISSVGSSSSDSIAECVTNKVKYQHDNTNHGVKTLARQLCSIRAQSSISPHIRAPPSLHCLCDRQRGLWATYLNRSPPGRDLELPRDELLLCAARGYTDIERTSAAAQLHNQGDRSRGNISCGITHRVRPQGQQTPSSRMLSARGVSAILAGAPRFDCSTRLWQQDQDIWFQDWFGW